MRVQIPVARLSTRTLGASAVGRSARQELRRWRHEEVVSVGADASVSLSLAVAVGSRPDASIFPFVRLSSRLHFISFPTTLDIESARSHHPSLPSPHHCTIHSGPDIHIHQACQRGTLIPTPRPLLERFIDTTLHTSTKRLRAHSTSL